MQISGSGPDFGQSIFCPPWIDENHPAALFAEHAEEFRILELDPELPAKTRSMYTFLKGRHDDYRC
ncbi:MAG TPA: hypothetical protein DG761_03025 [Gammaproteobacteria bacterium]|nr:hypothetical protein [Acidiferrobacteraceae bacterium]MDP6398587.1 hypothetical protein [Arenicellales bacterium]HCX86975.1 hypothetical protein [Gammaproteobacteria bacterium]MDP6552990.1 hypothetical protein [Arenicellales bacterium]MDP6791168.1 hypothetical protein [Arenicellales bacterium]